MDAIQTLALTKKYRDVTAVDHLNLSVVPGELFSLLGINGAGKSTTINMLSCITPPTSGDALLFGKSIRHEKSSIKTFIALSPQETAIAPNLTVLENLKMMYGFYGFPPSEKDTSIRTLTEKLGLNSVLQKKACKLSGGFQRRLSIALALIGRPQILFLDEPTLGLDVVARKELWDIILSLRGKITIVLTTHYMEEAESLSDRIGIMKDGKLLCTGTPDEIKSLTNTNKLEDAFIKIVKEEM